MYGAGRIRALWPFGAPRRPTQPLPYTDICRQEGVGGGGGGIDGLSVAKGLEQRIGFEDDLKIRPPVATFRAIHYSTEHML